MDKIFIETTQEKYDKKFKDGVKIVDPIEDMEKSRSESPFYIHA